MTAHPPPARRRARPATRTATRAAAAAAAFVAVALITALPLAGATHENVDRVLLAIDDGPAMYDLDGDCVGDTNNPQGARPVRSWRIGLPFVGPEVEPALNVGCRGGPQSWTVTVPAGRAAGVQGTIASTPDGTNLGAAGAQVHVHIYDEDDALVYSTALGNEWPPDPFLFPDDPSTDVLPPTGNEHHIQTVLGPGEYRIVEDVWSGHFVAWLTQLTVTEDIAGI